MNQAAPSIRQLMKRGHAALEKNQAKEAIALFDQVLGINPNHVEALHYVAYVMHAGGDYVSASRLYQRAIQADPTHIDSYLRLCKVLESQTRASEAIQLARTATQIAPQDPRTHAELVHQLIRFNQSTLGINYLEQVLPLFPNDQMLLQIYSIGLKMVERHDEADRAYAKLLKEHHVPLSAQVAYETYLPRLYRSVDDIDRTRNNYQAFLEHLIADKQKISIGALNFQPIFQFAFHNRDNKAMLQLFTRMLRTIVPELNYTANHCTPGHVRREGKIRIGFASKHMYNHSVGSCYRNVMIAIARDPAFELTFFNVGSIIDSGIQEIVDADIPMITLPTSIVGAREVIGKRELDILVYPDIGMDPMTSYLAMARLAPHQVVLQGHPETTGIDTIDYLVSSRSYEPPHADENYTERLLCNAGIDTSFKRPKDPNYWVSREQLGLPTDKKLYMCPMSIQKFHPDFDDVLASILNADPNGILVLFSDYQQLTASMLLQGRILKKCPKEQVIFMDWLPNLNDLFGAMKAADAILDTIYFGGGTTVQYAFNFGIPVVTMPGHYARGRVVYSYYSIMGVPDAPIASTPEEYVAQAVRLANDKDYAKKVSDEILARNSALFETEPYAPKAIQLMKDIMDQNLDAYKR